MTFLILKERHMCFTIYNLFKVKATKRFSSILETLLKIDHPLAILIIRTR